MKFSDIIASPECIKSNELHFSRFYVLFCFVGHLYMFALYKKQVLIFLNLFLTFGQNWIKFACH